MVMRTLAVVAMVLAGCASGRSRAAAASRSIWIDRWDWKSPGDIEAAIERCHRAGFTAVMFQVRGNGTVFFPSAVEIWSEQFGFADPGFDPLATAVRTAHARGLQLHAWVNVAPGWVAGREPTDPRQLWRARRGWFLPAADGQPPAAGSYLALDLCQPEVRRHVVDLCREIAQKYAVDGVHLDYIRFPDAAVDSTGEPGTDVQSLANFTTATGRTTAEREALRRWQRQSVTMVVHDVREALRGCRRDVTLSAAVFADPVVARERVRQDWPDWCRRRLVDWIASMNYTADDLRFDQLVCADVAAAAGVPVIVATGPWKHRDATQTRRQLDLALAGGAAGIGVFNWRALFGKSNEVSATRQQALQQNLGQWLQATAHRR